MIRQDLNIRRCAAVAAHRPAELRLLPEAEGLVAPSGGLAVRSSRVVADVLSLLPPLQRVAVLRHWSSCLRNQVLRIGIGAGASASAEQAPERAFAEPRLVTSI